MTALFCRASRRDPLLPPPRVLSQLILLLLQQSTPSAMTFHIMEPVFRFICIDFTVVVASRGQVVAPLLQRNTSVEAQLGCAACLLTVRGWKMPGASASSWTVTAPAMMPAVNECRRRWCPAEYMWPRQLELAGGCEGAILCGKCHNQ